MLSSITPLGERGRRRAWAATTSWYVAGSTTGGAAAGLLAGSLGALLPLAGRVALLLAAVLCLAAALADARGWRLPSWRRQVDEDWLVDYRSWVVGGGFGVQLGLGVVTIVTTAGVYATLVLAALTGSVVGGLVVGAVFGLARALPVLAARRVTTPDALGRLHEAVAAAGPRARSALVSVLAVGGLALLLGSAVGGGS